MPLSGYAIIYLTHLLWKHLEAFSIKNIKHVNKHLTMWMSGLPSCGCGPPRLPPPSCPDASGAGLPGTLCTLQTEGWKVSCGWHSDPCLEKQPTRRDTDNLPRFQGNSKNREGGAQDASDLHVLSEIPKAARIQGLWVSCADCCFLGPSSCCQLRDGVGGGGRI